MQSQNFLDGSLGGYTTRKPEKEESPLLSKRMGMVDDSLIVLEAYEAAFKSAGVQVSAVHFSEASGENIQELAQRILNECKNAEILLIDYYLGIKTTGDALIKELKVYRPDIVYVGFSSSDEVNDKFLSAGASHCVLKRTNAKESLSELALHL